MARDRLTDLQAPTTQVVDTLSTEYPLLGIAMRHHRTTRGEPLSFKDKPYLVELYCDAPRIDGFDAMKCVQVGWSELLVQLALERAGWAGRICAYVLPSFQLRDRFVQRRIHPLLEQVPAYAGKLAHGDIGSVRHKRFGQGALLFLGSNTVNDFIEFSADVLVVDEFDRCVQEHLAFARDRLRASSAPQLFRIGNPTLPREGVAALYDQSDGRKWHHRCGHCNERQSLDWLVNVVTRNDAGRWEVRDKARAEDGLLRPVCRRCGRPFDREAKGGQWVAERPDMHRRGYHISRLDVLSQDLRPLWREWMEAQGSGSKLVAFYASVLGLPYAPEGSAVTMDMLTRAACGDPMDEGGDAGLVYEQVVAGIDVGSRSLNVDICVVRQRDDDQRYVRIGRWTGEVGTFDAVYDLLVRYRVNVAVVDARPETRAAQQLRDRCTETGVCDVWLCQFHATDRVGAQDYGLRQDYDRKLVTVDRTQLLDATMDDARVHPARRTWPEDVWRVPGWADQMQAPKRVMNESGTRYVWSEGNLDDHYRFSDAYTRVAADIMATQGAYHG